jgi:hypothetical protein
MSIGNLKTDGNKGNNFPYQFRVLQGLQNIFDQLIAINADTTGIEAILTSIAADVADLATETTLLSVDTRLTSEVRTPGIRTFVNVADAIISGYYSFSIANVGSASGFVEGQVLPAGVTINFDGGALNNTLEGMSFDATGTTFVVTFIS